MVAREGESLYDLPILYKLEMVDGHRRTQGNPIVQSSGRAACNHVAGVLAVELEAQQRPVASEGSAALERRLECLGTRVAARVEEHPVHADRPAQGRIIGHRVG